MKTYYHGSTLSGIKVLEPQFDSRLGVEGVFVSDEPFGPMMFSLLPERSKVRVEYVTEKGKFIEGKVSSPALNEEGWLYTIQIEDTVVIKKKENELYLTDSVMVIKSERVTKEQLLKLGWKYEKIS